MTNASEPHHFGACPEDWDYFCWTLGLRQDLLPVVSNPKAVISEKSKMKVLGKTPSHYNKQQKVAGFAGWTTHIATEDDISQWRGQDDYGICIQTRLVRALDIDVPDTDLAKKIKAFIVKEKGFNFPARVRSNSGKCLFAFIVRGELPKRTVKVEGGIIEFLGTGQQFVAVGTHFNSDGKPSGARYEWATGNGIALPEKIPEISLEVFEEFWATLVAQFGIAASTEGKSRKPRSQGDGGKAHSDSVATYLADADLVLSRGREGQVFIDCPWKDVHTTDSGETQTVYFCAGSRDYKAGHFHCFHANCAERTDQDFLAALGYYINEFEDVSTPEDKAEEKKKQERFDLIPVDEFANRPPPPWIIKGILPKKELAVTYGGSGDGKTFLVLDTVMAIVRGVPWNGYRVTKGRVVYICAEGMGGFTTRLQAYAQHHGVNLSDLKNDLFIIPETPNFRTMNDVNAIAAKIKAKGQFDMIVVDTLAQVTPGADENTSKDMSEALQHCEMLRQSTGAMIHLIAHSGKDKTKGIRGWSGLKAPLAAEFEVSRNGKVRHLRVTKMKDGRDGLGWVFELKTIVVLEKDSDGDPVESCYVEFSDVPLNEKNEMSRWEKRALDAWEMLGGGNVVLKDLISAIAEKAPRGKAQRDRRREGAMQGIKGLEERGHFNVVGEKIMIDLSFSDDTK